MVLFLDFDGVLHPYPPTVAVPLWCRSDLLVDWLEAYPQVEVVVSSTWRIKYDLGAIRATLPERLSKRIVDCTGTSYEALYTRQHECEEWMKSNRRPWDSWVALDDSPWNFRPFERRLVLCEPSVGLTASEIEALTRKLQ